MKSDKPHNDFYPGIFQSRNVRYSQRRPFINFSSRNISHVSGTFFARNQHRKSVRGEKCEARRNWKSHGLRDTPRMLAEECFPLHRLLQFSRRRRGFTMFY